ncbi:MAG: YggS family pyridoxal phosphate-dependent enzyme [Gammaproteobacteria bacterium]|nr:YggS family pyridoxal phosphate-dependent enzyme [Gammaproteobacteria bacterium]
MHRGRLLGVSNAVTTVARPSIDAVRGAIGKAEDGARRRSGSVHLLAVSKARTVAEVRAAHGHGLRHFGENYVQEAIAKVQALADLDITWHFIGAIQSNKTQDLARHFQWIHTVDRTKVARRLSAAAERDLDVCIQVNIDAEPQKAGVDPDELPALVSCVADLPRLKLRGLMVIPEPGNPRDSFRRTRQLFDALSPSAGEHWDTLSMGMSDDFADAIAEGATLVRIGTAIFGPRT